MVGARVTSAFAAGSVGTGGFGVLPGLVLAYYLTDSLGVSAFWATAVVFLPKIADVLVDPVIGRLSDRLATRDGDRSRLMRWGALILVPAFTLTFCAPAWAGPHPAGVWVLVFFILSSVGFSLFQVPYIALPAELTDDPDERTRLVAIRIVVLSVAILVVGGGGPAVRNAVGGTAGYAVMAVVVSLLLGGGMLWTARGAAPAASAVHAVPAGRTSPLDAAPAPSGTWLSTVRDAADRPYQLLLAAFMLQALGTAVILAAAQYAATYLLGDESAITFLFIALVLPAVVVMPVWSRLAGRFGKKTSFLIATSVFTAGGLLLLPSATADGPWVFLATAFTGVGYAGTQAMPLAILADLLGDRDRARDAGTLSGLWTAGETTAMALGSVVVLILLGLSGFVSSSGDEILTQPDSALTGITLTFSLVPALLVAAGGLLLARVTFPEGPHD